MDHVFSSVLGAKKKAGVVEHPEVFGHAGYSPDEPPARRGCPSASHPTTSNRAPDGARLNAAGFHLTPFSGFIVPSAVEKASELLQRQVPGFLAKSVRHLRLGSWQNAQDPACLAGF